MNKNKIVTAACVLAAVASPSLYAGFPGVSMPSLPGSSTPAPTAAAPNGDQLVAAYAGADQEVVTSQAKFADALGLKDKAAEANAAVGALSSGSTSAANLGNIETESDGWQAAITKAQQGNVTFTDAAKQTYAEGLQHLAAGTAKTVGLKNNAMAFGKSAQAQIASASIIEKVSVTNKLAPGMYVAQHLPGHLASLGGTLKSAVDFAKSHDIPVPADATAALSSF